MARKDEKAVDPDVFLAQEDIEFLIQVLNGFSIRVKDADERYSILINAGIKPAFLSDLKLDTKPIAFATLLVAKFRSYRISQQHPDYHPMINLLQYLLNIREYALEDEEVELFTHLIERGQDNFNALIARRSVGRVESPQGMAIGTGTLIGEGLLLTCYHLFSKNNVKQAWVRFGYKAQTTFMATKDIFELDLNFVSKDPYSDYALLTTKGRPKQKGNIPVNAALSSEQKIHLIHHPLGQPVVISDGEIVRTGEQYIDHNASADNGSSGGPIFDQNWRFVAIHQGYQGINHIPPLGTTVGIPIRAIWEHIEHHLP